MKRIINDELSKRLVQVMADEYKKYFPDATVKMHRLKEGGWGWNADGVEMMGVQVEEKGENN